MKINTDAAIASFCIVLLIFLFSRQQEITSALGDYGTWVGSMEPPTKEPTFANSDLTLTEVRTHAWPNGLKIRSDMKITQEQYDLLIAMKPEKRVGDYGDPLTTKIYGILFAFSKSLELRDGHLDIITAEAAQKEIKDLINEMIDLNL